MKRTHRKISTVSKGVTCPLIVEQRTLTIVTHQMLLFKLVQMGINGRIFNLINSFLSRRMFQVRLASSLSTTETLENGISTGQCFKPNPVYNCN